MSYRARLGLVYLVAFIAVGALQPLLVSWRHPQAVWLWCDMFRLCEPA
jgi:hypothetical protein